MHKTDAPGNVAGMFTDGDPSTATLATRVVAKFMNAIQMEIVNVVLASGQTLNDADNTQLLQSLNRIFGRLNLPFQPLPSVVPDMKIRLLPGFVHSDGLLLEVGAQTSPTFTAPSVPNSRIDRVVIDRATGVLQVVQGIASTVPAAPAIPSGKAPVAQVLLTAGQTSITSSSIDDERAPYSLGLGMSAFMGLGGSVYAQSGNLMAAGAVPIGFGLPNFAAYTGPVVQGGCVYDLADGGEISRTAFPEYMAIVGTRHGAGNGSTTVNKPTTQGLFLRGRDAGQGRDPDASTRVPIKPGGAAGDAVGSYQDDQIRSHPHIAGASSSSSFAGVPVGDHRHALASNDPPHNPPGSQDGQFMNLSGGVATDGAYVMQGSPNEPGIYPSGAAGAHTPSGSVSTSTSVTVNPAGGNETRPRNVAVDWMVRIK